MHFQKPMLGNLLDWSNPLNKGLVMHLGMQEGHGDVVRDLSMNGNHGTLKNMAFPSTPVSGWNPGQTGIGLNFDGPDDYVDCGNNASLDITDAITISAWVKSHSFATRQTVFSKDQTTGHNPPHYCYHLRFNDSTSIRLLWNDGVVFKELAYVSPIPLNTNQWYHVVGILKSGEQKLYIDGNNVKTTAHGGAGVNFDSDLLIGKARNLVNYVFNGSIDQARIHNRALTAKEVMDYYINPWSVYMDEEGM